MPASDRAHIPLFLIFLSLTLAGCNSPFPDSEDISVEESIASTVERGIADGSLLDLEAMVLAEDRFSMRVREVTGSIQANATFAYDRNENISLIGLIYASPYQSVSFTIIEGGETYAIERDGNWSIGRDLSPSFHDPFSFESPEDQSPSSVSMPAAELPADVADLRSLDWSISHDADSGQIVAMADNDTATIILEFSSGVEGVHIVSMEAFGSSDSYTRIVRFDRGGKVVIALPNEAPRMAFPLLMESHSGSAEDGDFITSGEMSPSFRWEVDPSDVTLEVVEELDGVQTVIASLLLSDESTSIVDSDGSNWTASWSDTDDDGLVSAGDGYNIRTDSNRSFRVRFNDSWAGAYAIDPLSAPGLPSIVIAISLAHLATFVRRREVDSSGTR